MINNIFTKVTDVINYMKTSVNNNNNIFKSKPYSNSINDSLNFDVNTLYENEQEYKNIDDRILYYLKYFSKNKFGKILNELNKNDKNNNIINNIYYNIRNYNNALNLYDVGKFNTLYHMIIVEIFTRLGIKENQYYINFYEKYTPGEDYTINIKTNIINNDLICIDDDISCNRSILIPKNKNYNNNNNFIELVYFNNKNRNEDNKKNYELIIYEAYINLMVTNFLRNFIPNIPYFYFINKSYSGFETNINNDTQRRNIQKDETITNWGFIKEINNNDIFIFREHIQKLVLLKDFLNNYYNELNNNNFNPILSISIQIFNLLILLKKICKSYKICIDEYNMKIYENINNDINMPYYDIDNNGVVSILGYFKTKYILYFTDFTKSGFLFEYNKNNLNEIKIEGIKDILIDVNYSNLSYKKFYNDFIPVKIKNNQNFDKFNDYFNNMDNYILGLLNNKPRNIISLENYNINNNIPFCIIAQNKNNNNNCNTDIFNRTIIEIRHNENTQMAGLSINIFENEINNLIMNLYNIINNKIVVSDPLENFVNQILEEYNKIINEILSIEDDELKLKFNVIPSSSSVKNVNPSEKPQKQTNEIDINDIIKNYITYIKYISDKYTKLTLDDNKKNQNNKNEIANIDKVRNLWKNINKIITSSNDKKSTDAVKLISIIVQITTNLFSNINNDLMNSMFTEKKINNEKIKNVYNDGKDKDKIKLNIKETIDIFNKNITTKLNDNNISIDIPEFLKKIIGINNLISFDKKQVDASSSINNIKNDYNRIAGEIVSKINNYINFFNALVTNNLNYSSIMLLELIIIKFYIFKCVSKKVLEHKFKISKDKSVSLSSEVADINIINSNINNLKNNIFTDLLGGKNKNFDTNIIKIKFVMRIFLLYLNKYINFFINYNKNINEIDNEFISEINYLDEIIKKDDIYNDIIIYINNDVENIIKFFIDSNNIFIIYIYKLIYDKYKENKKLNNKYDNDNIINDIIFNDSLHHHYKNQFDNLIKLFDWLFSDRKIKFDRRYFYPPLSGDDNILNELFDKIMQNKKYNNSIINENNNLIIYNKNTYFDMIPSILEIYIHYFILFFKNQNTILQRFFKDEGYKIDIDKIPLNLNYINNKNIQLDIILLPNKKYNLENIINDSITIIEFIIDNKI